LGVAAGGAQLDRELDRRTSVFLDQFAGPLDATDWNRLMAEVRPILSGDIAADESATSRQLAHFATGIRVTVADDVIYLSSSYSVVGVELGLITETLRDLAMTCEMVTGRTAISVIFDQPGLVSADIAGRPRIHGYVLFGRRGGPAIGAGGTMTLPVSELAYFDRHVSRRNAV
jgi:hypothetical protein